MSVKAIDCPGTNISYNITNSCSFKDLKNICFSFSGYWICEPYLTAKIFEWSAADNNTVIIRRDTVVGSNSFCFDIPPNVYHLDIYYQNGYGMQHKGYKILDITDKTPQIVNRTINNSDCEQNNGSIIIETETNGNYRYNWSDGQTTKDIYELSPGMYYVTITNLDIENCFRHYGGYIVLENCLPCDNCISSFSPLRNQKYILSAWVKENEEQGSLVKNYEYAQIEILFPGSTTPAAGSFKAKGKIIEGWQKIEEEFTIPPDATEITVRLTNTNPSVNAYYDDIRVHPFNSSFKSFVYDPVTLRLMAELDDRNYATKYEYDLEGKLIRVKKETERGVETIKESRNNTYKKP